MPDIHYWAQTENRPWDASPNNIDRMHRTTDEEFHKLVPPTRVTIKSLQTCASVKRNILLPVSTGIGDMAGDWNTKDALIARRCSEDWAAQDDVTMNPSNTHAHNPTETGKMGRIPGPAL